VGHGDLMGIEHRSSGIQTRKLLQSTLEPNLKTTQKSPVGFTVFRPFIEKGKKKVTLKLLHRFECSAR